MSKAYCEQFRLPKIKGSSRKREIAIDIIRQNFDLLQSYAQDFDRCGDGKTAERCHAAAEAYEMTVLSLFRFFTPRMNTSMVIEHREKFEMIRTFWTRLEVVDYTEHVSDERTLSYRNPLEFNPRFEGCRKNRCMPLHAVADPYSALIIMGNALLNRRFEAAAGCYYRASEKYAEETRELIRQKGAEANCVFMMSNRKQFIKRAAELLEREMTENQIPHIQMHLMLLDF